MEYKNNMIKSISDKYDGNIRKYPPVNDNAEMSCIPVQLMEILKSSNGIMETMQHLQTGECIDIGWIIYPLDEILSWTQFFRETYSLEGIVFADDGAGNPYYLKRDGKVYQFECIDGEEQMVSGSLENFLKDSW